MGNDAAVLNEVVQLAESEIYADSRQNKIHLLIVHVEKQQFGNASVCVSVCVCVIVKHPPVGDDSSIQGAN